MSHLTLAQTWRHSEYRRSSRSRITEPESASSWDLCQLLRQPPSGFQVPYANERLSVHVATEACRLFRARSAVGGPSRPSSASLTEELASPSRRKQSALGPCNTRTCFPNPSQSETSTRSRENSLQPEYRDPDAAREVCISAPEEGATCSAAVQCDILPSSRASEAVSEQVERSPEQTATGGHVSGRRRVSFSERAADIIAGQTSLHAGCEQRRSPAFAADKDGPPLNFGESVVNRRPTPFSYNGSSTEEDDEVSSEAAEGGLPQIQNDLISQQSLSAPPVLEERQGCALPQPNHARRRVSFRESPITVSKPRASCSERVRQVEVKACAQNFLKYLYAHCGRETEVIRRSTPWPRPSDEEGMSDGLPQLNGIEVRELSKALVATLTDVTNVIEPAAAALVEGAVSHASCLLDESMSEDCRRHVAEASVVDERVSFACIP